MPPGELLAKFTSRGLTEQIAYDELLRAERDQRQTESGLQQAAEQGLQRQVSKRPRAGRRGGR